MVLSSQHLILCSDVLRPLRDGQPQGLYYYTAAEPAVQYPYLQYQYAVPTYTLGAAQEGIAPTMLYPMPMMMA